MDGSTGGRPLFQRPSPKRPFRFRPTSVSPVGPSDDWGGWRLCENALLCYLFGSAVGVEWAVSSKVASCAKRFFWQTASTTMSAKRNPVRVIDVFVGELDLGTLALKARLRQGGPATIGDTPGVYLYGYMNQVQSSRRLISYIWTREGWLYLAVVLDLYSRRAWAGRRATVFTRNSR